MKKTLFLLLFISGTYLSCLAQSAESKKFNIGFEAGVPTGDVHTTFGTVIGGSVKYESPIIDGAWFTFSGGYNSLIVKGEFKVDGGKSAIGFIPLKIGLKYYMRDGFFAEGAIGATFSTESEVGTLFAYSPGIGYTFNGGFETGLRY